MEMGRKVTKRLLVLGFAILAALLLTPLIGVVPSYAAAPALIMVGLFMMKEVQHIRFNTFSEGFPAFIIIVMIALSYSISIGLAFGFVSHVLIQVVSGQTLRVKPALWIVALLSSGFLVIEKCPAFMQIVRQWIH